jgi:hypothetical protein
MPYRALAQQALARWREAERRKDAAVLHSPEWEAANADAASAKADYMQCVDDARREYRPEPPPFEEAVTGTAPVPIVVGEGAQARET